MIDGGQRALRAVRMVRERAEEREELALGEISRQVERARVAVDIAHVELAAFCEGEARRLGELLSGAELRQGATERTSLQQREADAMDELRRSEERQLEQAQRYRGAHAACEAIKALQEQRRLAGVAASEMQERKAGEELFLGRRTWLQQQVERGSAI